MKYLENITHLQLGGNPLSILFIVLTIAGCEKMKRNNSHTAAVAIAAATSSKAQASTGTATAAAAAPTFSPAAGYYAAAQNITVTTTTSGASIYFTTDGNTPTASSAIYSKAIHIWYLAGKAVKAFAVKSGMTDSATATLSGVFSYPPLKSGQTVSYQAGDDGAMQNGVARSYTGPTAHTTYTSDYTTTDNATGLVWKTCSQGLSGAVCAAGTVQALINDGTAADATNHTTWGCSVLNSTNSGNGYAGLKTWRLPTRQELETLLHYGVAVAPLVNGTAFPAMDVNNYWSSTTVPFLTANAYSVSFNDGTLGHNTKTTTNPVICVSGVSKGYYSNFTDNGDGTVKDNSTGLIWQKCSIGQTNDAACTGAGSPSLWSAAITTCSGLGLASRTWRLPNTQDLKSLIDTTTTAAAKMDGIAFPNAIAGNYWGSTTYATTTTLAFTVSTANGNFAAAGKGNSYYVRCVSGP